MDTPDPGSHVELNVADIQLDLGYGDWMAARAKVHVAAKHRRNPTSTDDDIDADELWVRIGEKPEFLARPERHVVLPAGRQVPEDGAPAGAPARKLRPRRDVVQSLRRRAGARRRHDRPQLLLARAGREWQSALHARSERALRRQRHARSQVIEGKEPELGSGFPILYNAETEDLFFDTSNVQIGEALGYRWQSDDETLGFDVIVFHYQRDLADTVRAHRNAVRRRSRSAGRERLRSRRLDRPRPADQPSSRQERRIRRAASTASGATRPRSRR